MSWQDAVKRGINLVGLEVLRLKNVPRLTFLGLDTRKFDAIFDVGANDGGFARWIAPRFPGVPVHCFEPLPAPGEALRRWAAREHKQVIVHTIALSDAPGEARFLEHVDHPTSSSMLPVTDKSRELYPFTSRAIERVVPVSTLDGWAEISCAAANCILLKLDVQGLEDKVLRGAYATLNRVDVCIVEVSIVGLYQGQARFIDIANMLGAAGLEYFGNLDQFHDERGAPIFLDAVFVRNAARGGEIR